MSDISRSASSTSSASVVEIAEGAFTPAFNAASHVAPSAPPPPSTMDACVDEDEPDEAPPDYNALFEQQHSHSASLPAAYPPASASFSPAYPPPSAPLAPSAMYPPSAPSAAAYPPPQSQHTNSSSTLPQVSSGSSTLHRTHSDTLIRPHAYPLNAADLTAPPAYSPANNNVSDASSLLVHQRDHVISGFHSDSSAVGFDPDPAPPVTSQPGAASASLDADGLYTLCPGSSLEKCGSVVCCPAQQGTARDTFPDDCHRKCKFCILTQCAGKQQRYVGCCMFMVPVCAVIDFTVITVVVCLMIALLLLGAGN